MTQEKLVTICVAGEQGHGKTALVRWLAKMAGGVSEKGERKQLGPPPFIPVRISPGTLLALIDLPGGETANWQALRDSLREVDLGVLVVAADQGVSVRTKHFLDFFRAIKIRNGLVVLTKADLVDEETIEFAQIEVREALEGSPLDGKLVVPFSELDGRYLQPVLAAFQETIDPLEGGRYFSTPHYKSLKKQVIGIVTEILEEDVFKMTVSPKEMRHRLETDWPESLLKHILRDLEREGKLLLTHDGGYRLPSMSVRVPLQRPNLAERMLEYARAFGNTSFSARTLCQLHWKTFDMHDVNRLLMHLCHQNRLVRLNDGRYLTAEALEDIKKKVSDWLACKGRLTIHDSREIFGYGRTRAVPILEHLDAIGVTCRLGDVRVLACPRSTMHQEGHA